MNKKLKHKPTHSQNKPSSESPTKGFIYRLLEYMDIPITGKAGKRNLIVLGAFYLFSLLMIIANSANIPTELICLTIAFPILFLAAIGLLAGLKWFFNYIFHKLPLWGFIASCSILFILWTALTAFVFIKLRDMQLIWNAIPMDFLIIATVLIISGFLIMQIIFFWWDNTWNSKTTKEKLKSLPIHLLLYIPAIILIILYQHNQIDLNLYEFQDTFISFFALQYLLYCFTSVIIWLWTLNRIVNLALFGKKQKKQQINIIEHRKKSKK